MLRYIRSLLIAARNQPYIPSEPWDKDDAEVLTKYLSTPSGKKFKAIMAQMTVSSMNSAVTHTNTLQHSCGYASGFRGAVSAIESLASSSWDKNFSDDGPMDSADGAVTDESILGATP